MIPTEKTIHSDDTSLSSSTSDLEVSISGCYQFINQWLSEGGNHPAAEPMRSFLKKRKSSILINDVEEKRSKEDKLTKKWVDYLHTWIIANRSTNEMKFFDETKIQQWKQESALVGDRVYFELFQFEYPPPTHKDHWSFVVMDKSGNAVLDNFGIKKTITRSLTEARPFFHKDGLDLEIGEVNRFFYIFWSNWQTRDICVKRQHDPYQNIAKFLRISACHTPLEYAILLIAHFNLILPTDNILFLGMINNFDFDVFKKNYDINIYNILLQTKSNIKELFSQSLRTELLDRKMTIEEIRLEVEEKYKQTTIKEMIKKYKNLCREIKFFMNCTDTEVAKLNELKAERDQTVLNLEKLGSPIPKEKDKIPITSKTTKITRVLQPKLQTRWLKQYNDLKHFIKEFGRYPKKYALDQRERQLAQWVISMRAARKKRSNYRLDKKRIASLEDLPNWCWERTKEVIWHEVCHEYKKGPPYTQRQRNWAQTQRQYKKLGRLSRERTLLLGNIQNWHWGAEDKYMTIFYSVRHFILKYGYVPSSNAKDIHERKLGKWCTVQRLAARGVKGYYISQERIQLISGLPNWDWGPIKGAHRKLHIGSHVNNQNNETIIQQI